MKYNKISILVGVFTILMIVVFALAIANIAREKGFFEKKIYIYLLTRQADYFAEGMSVYYNGVEIATVNDMELRDDGKVTLKVEIKENNHKWIREDAEFELDKPLIGSPKIRVRSTMDKPMIANGDEREIKVKDGINDVIDRLEPVLQITENITTNLAILVASTLDKDEPLQKILHNVESFTDKLDKQPIMTTLTGDGEIVSKIKFTLDGLNKSIDEANTLMDSSDKLVKNIDKTVVNTNDNIITPMGTGMTNVNAIIEDIRAKVKKLDAAVDTIVDVSPEITTLTKEVKATVDKADRLIDKYDSVFDDYNKNEVALP